MLNRDDILAAVDLPRESVAVPEWGGTVMVKTLTGRERDRFELSCQGATRDNIRATLAALACCDENGVPLFTPADIPALGEKSAAALDRIFDVAARLNRIGAPEVEKKD